MKSRVIRVMNWRFSAIINKLKRFQWYHGCSSRLFRNRYTSNTAQHIPWHLKFPILLDFKVPLVLTDPQDVEKPLSLYQLSKCSINLTGKSTGKRRIANLCWIAIYTSQQTLSWLSCRRSLMCRHIQPTLAPQSPTLLPPPYPKRAKNTKNIAKSYLPYYYTRIQKFFPHPRRFSSSPFQPINISSH